MFLRALLAFLVLPGLAALLLPAVIARFDPWRSGPVWPGLLVMLLGMGILLWCVRDFYVSGKGTLGSTKETGPGGALSSCQKPHVYWRVDAD